MDSVAIVSISIYYVFYKKKTENLFIVKLSLLIKYVPNVFIQLFKKNFIVYHHISQIYNH